MLKAVLIDLDGTLTKFNIDIMAMSRALHDIVEEEMLGELFTGVERPFQYFMRLNELRDTLGEDKYLYLRRRFHDEACRIEVAASVEAVKTPYSKDFLEGLEALGLKMGLVTNSCRKAAENVLDRLGFRRFFKVIIARDDVDRMKPYPDPLNKAVSILGVSPSETLYIGDSIMDVLAGDAAGITTIYLDTTKLPPIKGLSIEPKYKVLSLDEALQLVKSLLQ